MDNHLINQLRSVCLSMFRKNFFGIYHGSISAKTDYNRFIINKKEAIFDDIDEHSLIELYFNKDYRWNEASIDSYIHQNIYQNIPEAKYVAFGMPPYTTAYCLEHSKIVPKDYFGYTMFESLKVYDPKSFDNWYERADVEIYRHLKNTNSNIMIIKGYGVYVYDRDINQLAKKIAVIENSCRLLFISHSF
ncbi:MAG: class II aldolase/adducin family protein [Campylobacterales bacterium]|nr:class II aldolase/adducin family protein [Campylobacterales bacterium]